MLQYLSDLKCYIDIVVVVLYCQSVPRSHLVSGFNIRIL